MQPRSLLLLPYQLCLLACLLLGFTLPVCAQVLEHAEFSLSDSTAPPPPEAHWRSLRLPHVWSGEDLPMRGGWYRLRFTVPASTQPLALYLAQTHLNAAVYLNGVRIADGGRLEDPMTYAWNYPLFAAIPAALLRPENNELLIRLRVEGGFGMLSRIELGPADELARKRDRRAFWQAEIHGGFSMILLGLTALGFGIWRMRRHDTQYMWSAASNLSWAVFAWFLYTRHPWPDGLAMQWLAHLGAKFWLVFLICFVHRQIGIRRPTLEIAFAILSLVLMLLALLLPGEQRPHLYSLGHIFTLAALLYLIVALWLRWRQSQQKALLILASTLLLVWLAAVHDVVITLPTAWLSVEIVERLSLYRFYLTPFGAPLVSLILTAHLARRFTSTLNAVEALNNNLETRVTDARERLEASFETRRAMERQQAAAEERERIWRDLHDDMGARLLSLAIGAQRAGQREQADLARSALQDLRDVVSRSVHESFALADLLADWRIESSQRVSNAGLQFEWLQADDVPAIDVSATAALELGRIQREAVSNVLRHADARRLQCAVSVTSEHLLLSICDDGRGFEPATTRHNRGLSNIKARASSIGGAAQWISQPGAGCKFCLSLPRSSLSPSSSITPESD